MNNINMIVAVVLAAGQSRRMGAAKQLLSWGDKTILATTLTHVMASSVDEVVVVTGGYADEVARISAEFTSHIVHNPQFATDEMVSSLRVGVGAVSAETTAILVTLGDMPLVQPQTFDQIANHLREHPERIVVPTFEGKRGHPVGFGRTYFSQLSALTNAQTPRAIIQQNLEAVTFLPVADHAILIDIDTKESYEKWRPPTD